MEDQRPSLCATSQPKPRANFWQAVQPSAESAARRVSPTPSMSLQSLAALPSPRGRCLLQAATRLVAQQAFWASLLGAWGLRLGTRVRRWAASDVSDYVASSRPSTAFRLRFAWLPCDFVIGRRTL